MANHDGYDRDYARRYVREERRDDRDPRYVETRESYVKAYPDRGQLVPRAREDSDLSVEEIRRDFPPPTGGRRAKSAEPGYYDEEYEYRRSYDPRYDSDRRSRRSPGSTYYDEDERKSSKSKSGMSKQEKIIAAVAGAALLAGGKELYDRREAKEGHTEVHRNALSTAALAGVGALAAYQGAEFYSKKQAKKDEKANYILHRGRDGHIDEYYSDDGYDSKEKKGHKNFLENAIAATGLGAVVKSLTGGGGHDERSDTRSRRGGSVSSSRSRSRSGANKIQKAAMASLLAGATEAFRVAKEPGGWKGEKTKRILTAAAGAAAVDSATDDKHGKLGLAESVIGGLVGNRLLRGSKNEIEEDKSTGRSRSRSRARSKSRGGGGSSGLAALATAGLSALGAKKALDHSRSRSRRDRDDSYSPSPDRRRHRSRSRSVVDKARNSLAKLGIGAGAGAAGIDATDAHRRREQDDFSERGSRRRHYSDDDDYDDGYRRGGSNKDYYEDDRSQRSKPRNRSKGRGGRSDTSESDLGDSDEDEKRAKRMKGKQILTTGLAAVATIHATHEVYQSMEKRNARHKAVKEGRLSPEEARKLKTKAIMQDAASVGIAAMGIKGAISELKEAKHMQKECKEFQEEKARRHARRLEKQRRGIVGRKRSDSWAPSSQRRENSYDGYDDDRYGGYDSGDEHGAPRYYDGNPYRATLPAPQGRRY
ncbi:Fc.00g069360.m01.CDS01 [Cosmosporella sp. VM-42]